MSESTGLSFRLPPELIEHLNRGDCVLFVGDALDAQGSQSARLASALVDACGAHSACPIPACQSSGKCTQPQTCAIPLTRAAQLHESRKNRQALVDFVMRHVDNASPPGPVHRALAAMPVRVIITTAYDDRLKVALDMAERPTLSVVRDTDVPFDDPGRVQLIRLHGTVSQPDSLVLTEDDAADLFARLPIVTKILQGHFASKTLLFVGYRLGDPHFLALYRQVTGPIARYQRLAYAVQWPPDPLAVDRWRGKITLIEAELLPFLIELAKSIRVQAVEAKRAVLPPEPYKFLDYYTAEDAAIFFGRDLEADLLLSTILAHELTVFYGRSGTGKTSLLLAGVGPALEEVGYRVAYARMLGDPTSEVKSAVRGVRVDQLAYADRGRRLYDVLADALPPAGRLVVVLDQFEEFFVRQGEAVRRAFAQELADCLWPTDSEGQMAGGDLDLRFVLSLRDDYLGALDELSDVLPRDVFAHRYRLENLTREKALLAILKPAEAFGLPIEESLRGRLIADLEDQGLEPANLQIVLYRLYRDAVEQGLWFEDDRRGTGLTLARYEVLGETRKILAGYLDEVLEELGQPKEQQQAQAILKSMVTAERTKAAVSGREIARNDLVTQVGLAEAQLDELLTYLREKRVVRKFGDEDRYELAHEVMVERVWAWVSDEELRLLDVRDMLRREMSSYEKFGHLMTREKLELVTSCHEALTLNVEELDLLFRSALDVGYEVRDWFGRARDGGVAVERILKEGLESEQPNIRADAAAILGDLDWEGAVDWLAEALEDDYPHVRARIRESLQKIGTPQALQILRDHLPKGMIYIPAGKSVMGDDKGEHDNEKPAHKVYLDAFYIGKYPVTNAEYAKFVECTDRRPPDHWSEGKIPRGKEHHPVVNVTWYDARDYATWAGMRLPTEAEWEKAASWDESTRTGLRGLSGKRGRKHEYPWGDEFDKNKCNTFESDIDDTTPVGKYSPGGDSPYGVADMAGNVFEWTSSLNWDYPYRADDGREDPTSPGGRVLRGGSFTYDVRLVRCANRIVYNPRDRDWDLGLRVAAAPFTLSPSAL